MGVTGQRTRGPRPLASREPISTSEGVTAQTVTSSHHSTEGRAPHLPQMGDRSSSHPPQWWLSPQRCTPEKTTCDPKCRLCSP